MQNQKSILFYKIILPIVLIVCCLAGVTGAIFADTADQNLTITLKNGIKLETTGLTQNGEAYILNFSEKDSLSPNTVVTVENVTVKVKSDSDSSDVYLRYKLTYQYKNSGDANWTTATASNCYLTTELTPNSTSGFYANSNWTYCLNASTVSISNLKTVSTTSAVTLFDNNQLTLSKDIPADYQIQIILTIQAVQSTQEAAQFEWNSDF